MRFTQIVTDAGDSLFALGEDGSIYRLDHYEEKTGETSFDEFGGQYDCVRWIHYWNRLEFPIGDPRK